MTTFDRFDPFERRIGEALDGIAPPRSLDYLDDIFRQTARTSQRPRWSFPERWFNVDTTFARPALFGRCVPVRSLIVLVVLAALLAATVVYVGTQKRLPPAFGPADNGQIVFGVEGDLFVRDTLTGTSRFLLGGEGDQGGAVSSPDGQLIAYDSVVGGADRVWVADSDGSNPRQVLDRAFTGESFAWAPDSQSMAIVTHAARPELWIAPADGSGARLLKLEGLYAWEAVWDPQRPGVLLVRAEDILMKDVDLYYVDVNGTGTILSKLDMTGMLVNGPAYEFSGLAISPDGKTIAYNAIEAEEPPVNRFRVHVMNRDGTNDRPIPAPRDTLYSQGWAVFSPDGKWIAMESWVTQPDNTAVNQVAIARADGSETARWIGPSVPGRSLVKLWSPDGTGILMHVNDADDVYLIDPVSGAFELLPWKSDFPDWQRIAR